MGQNPQENTSRCPPPWEDSAQLTGSTLSVPPCGRRRTPRPPPDLARSPEDHRRDNPSRSRLDSGTGSASKSTVVLMGPDLQHGSSCWCNACRKGCRTLSLKRMEMFGGLRCLQGHSMNINLQSAYVKGIGAPVRQFDAFPAFRRGRSSVLPACRCTQEYKKAFVFLIIARSGNVHPAAPSDPF